MKHPTNRDVRNPVVLAVIITTIVMMALLDPLPAPRRSVFAWTSRSVAP